MAVTMETWSGFYCPQRKRGRKRSTQDTSAQELSRLELELMAYLHQTTAAAPAPAQSHNEPRLRDGDDDGGLEAGWDMAGR
uniref:Uncharacterized protein n=1 Tax=Knipowitschia caucasica TaxID=637954 RepID=A0AAV2KEQ6_KNICA